MAAIKVSIGTAVSRLLTSDALRDWRRLSASIPRRLTGGPAKIDYFHQVDDPYSHLMVQVLSMLRQRYRVDLHCHLVPPPDAAAAPDRERLRSWSRRDAAMLANQLHLKFSDHRRQPAEEQVSLAQSVLAAARDAEDFIAKAVATGNALWNDGNVVNGGAADSAAGSSTDVAAVLSAGAKVRSRHGHYLGATLLFENEWFWGVDRLHHLERRLRELGLASGASTEPKIANIPELQLSAKPTNGRRPQLDFYCSLRSPYTYLSVPRLKQLASHYGAQLNFRFVMPMVMRGLPVPLAKRLYIVRDTKREADYLGMPFGRIADPVGTPTERGLAVLHQAVIAGKGTEFGESFLRGVWAEGIDAGSEDGLCEIAQRAGLDAAFVVDALADKSWQAVAEANRAEMFALGLWGVPSFRVDDGPGYWGQDRLWLIERDLVAATEAK